jgi:hypothetical protein
MIADYISWWRGRRSTAAPSPTGQPSASVRKNRRSWRGFGRDVLLYAAVYIVVSGLSIGPLFWVWFGAVYADGPKWLAKLYLPLAYLCEICSPLRWVVNTWINWWIL